MPSKKIANHPEKRKIINMLRDGVSVRQVKEYLDGKYPHNPEYRLTTRTIQAFRQDKLNIEKEVLKDIKASEGSAPGIDRLVKGSSAYKKKIEEAATYHVDLKKELVELTILIKARVNALFDKAERGEATVNEEGNLQKHMSTWLTTLERYAKYVEKIADKTVEANINVNVIEGQISVLQEAILEAIAELPPEQSSLLLDKIKTKMEMATYKKDKLPSFDALKVATEKDLELLEAELDDE